MAVAAYAAVVSLMHLLDQIQQYHSRLRLHLDIDRIETLHGKVSFLQEFLEVHSERFEEDLEGLARQIAAVAVEAEDIIDSHVVDQLQKEFADKSDMDLSISCEGIYNVIGKIGSIEKELSMIEVGLTIQEQRPGVSIPTGSSPPPLSSNNTMIGFDEHLCEVMDGLTGHESRLQVLCIVGMGGIGKTTLAQNAFEGPLTVHHFDIRIWLTISQDYNIHQILLSFLESIGTNKGNDKSTDELGEQLYKRLYGRRYLIVLDDVWSTKIWDDIKMFLPDHDNRSRILVTTRLSDVAVYLSTKKPYFMDSLDEDESWELFCNIVFAKEGCPPELEEVGKIIAKSCKGLPLAIVVIGGLLLKSGMTREHWEHVATNVNSFAYSGGDEHYLKILSLSYNHLPIHLKPCFLYMRVVPEDDEIEVSKLIRLWVAEGFLKPMKDKTLEEVAEEYLHDLIGRNLISIHQLWDNGKIKTCRIHDLLRDICLTESYKEQFYFEPKAQNIDLEDSETTCLQHSGEEASTRRGQAQFHVASQRTSLASCLVCDDCRIMYPQLSRMRWVKVLDRGNMWSSDKDILHPTKLRYLSIDGDFKFAGNLRLLWNLQTLVINSYKRVLPSEIWEMPQLRHLLLHYAFLSDPPDLITQVDRKGSTASLENLQTLSAIRNFRWSMDAVERLPNMKTLGISCDQVQEWSYYSLQNLGHLHKLESLRLEAKALFTLKNIAFPHSLKKLSLGDCNIPWEEMTIIGSLPNLEVLELYRFAFTGREWNPLEGEFLQLKILIICNSDLVCWEAEEIHFPRLEHLQLGFMRDLKQIPSGLGEIVTLSLIRLDFCPDAVVISAKEMLEEQRDFGNEDIELLVNP